MTTAAIEFSVLTVSSAVILHGARNNARVLYFFRFLIPLFSLSRSLFRPVLSAQVHRDRAGTVRCFMTRSATEVGDGQPGTSTVNNEYPPERRWYACG